MKPLSESAPKVIEAIEVDMSNAVKIEHHIPIPDGISAKWPFHDMEVNDSFHVPDDKRSSVQSMAFRIGARTGKKFVVRTMKNKKTGLKEVRCWRVK